VSVLNSGHSTCLDAIHARNFFGALRTKNMETDWKKRLVALRQSILESFESADWEGIEQLRKQSDVLMYYPRLLLNLSKENGNYPGEVFSVLTFIATNDPKTFNKIESYAVLRILDRRANRRVTVAPKFFGIPALPVVPELVAVVMPFQKDFSRVFEAIELACSGAHLHCRRGDDVWDDSAAMQDVFNLVFHSGIVIADFTGKNPNVMYEIGIAHTLGKHVVPISQSLDDVPLDLISHRVLRYTADPDGLLVLQSRLEETLLQVTPPAIEDIGVATAKVVPIRQRS